MVWKVKTFITRGVIIIRWLAAASPKLTEKCRRKGELQAPIQYFHLINAYGLAVLSFLTHRKPGRLPLRLFTVVVFGGAIKYRPVIVNSINKNV
jgi:hypothetical protein